MARDKNRGRSNLGEQVDSSEMERTSIERQDQSMGAGSRTDSSVGSEGIEDPSLERSRRENMSGSERESKRESGRHGQSGQRQSIPREQSDRSTEQSEQ